MLSHIFMVQKIIGKGILPFVASISLGLTGAWFVQRQQTPEPSASTNYRQSPVKNDTGSGIASDCFDCGPTNRGVSARETVPTTAPVKITAKPKAQYTDEARTNEIQGTVRLKIVLLADGEVVEITPITKLPFGLTEQAIAAARQIKFEPRKVNGVAQSSVMTFEYSFTIY